jgi:uncharacterized protein YbjT (DUF2867 family)
VQNGQSMILVAGATGNAGGAVGRALVAEGEDVRALVRPSTDQSALPPGVDAVVGDLNQPASLDEALDGVSAVFLLSGYEDMPATLARIGDAGAERVVLLSSSAAPGGDMSNAVARYHILSEQQLRDSGLPCTILQPNTFMSNSFDWLPQIKAGDTVRAPFASVRVATIDPDDLGAVAAAALTSDAHEGRVYRLSGPESLSPADRVRELGNVLGRDLHFDAQSDADARAEMSSSMPAEYVDAFFSFFAEGTLDESEVLPTVRKITGREPRSFEQWATAHADAFR